VRGRRQHVVGPHRGGVHADIDIDEQFAELGQHALDVVRSLVADELVVRHQDRALDRVIDRHLAATDGFVDHLLHFLDIETRSLFQFRAVVVQPCFDDLLAVHEFAQTPGFEAWRLARLHEGQHIGRFPAPVGPGAPITAAVAAVAGQRAHQDLHPLRVDAVQHFR